MKFYTKTILTTSVLLNLIFCSSCKKDSSTESAKDTEKPTVTILFPISGSIVKADTIYTVIVTASDNRKVVKVEFYINNQNISSDSLSPFEYRWDTQGLSGNQTIMAKAFDETNNIELSSEVSVSISGVGLKSQDLIQVVGGTFQMGSTDGNENEEPIHSVTVSTFNIDKYEIMYEKWTEVMNWGKKHGYTDLFEGRNGYNPSETNNPVAAVSWYDIIKWCNARSEKDGFEAIYFTDSTQTTVYRMGELNISSGSVKWMGTGYRLPTEAEWEFAARGGTKSNGFIYSGSDSVGEVAWYRDNSLGMTHKVATKYSNQLGIYDMSGNVFELCWDWYGLYSYASQNDPKGNPTGTYHVIRGGSFDSELAIYCRVALRGYDTPSSRDYFVGFRCVKVN